MYIIHTDEAVDGLTDKSDTTHAARGLLVLQLAAPSSRHTTFAWISNHRTPKVLSTVFLFAKMYKMSERA